MLLRLLWHQRLCQTVRHRSLTMPKSRRCRSNRGRRRAAFRVQMCVQAEKRHCEAAGGAGGEVGTLLVWQRPRHRAVGPQLTLHLERRP